MSQTDDQPLAADRSQLAEQLHEAGCLNVDPGGCSGRADHEREMGLSYLAVVDTNLRAGWTPPVPADGSGVPAHGGAVVVSVKQTSKTEPKVRAGAIWAGLGTLAVGVAGLVLANPALIGPVLPAWAVPGVLALAAAVWSLYGGRRGPFDTSRVRVTPVGDAAETTGVIDLRREGPLTDEVAVVKGEEWFDSYRHTAVDPSSPKQPDWTG